jgi:hypothetical protein
VAALERARAALRRSAARGLPSPLRARPGERHLRARDETIVIGFDSGRRCVTRRGSGSFVQKFLAGAAVFLLLRAIGKK